MKISDLKEVLSKLQGKTIKSVEDIDYNGFLLKFTDKTSLEIYAHIPNQYDSPGNYVPEFELNVEFLKK